MAALLAAAMAVVLSPALAAAAQAPVREYDAPDVETARRSIQDEIALAKKHSMRKKPLPIFNATTTTTPEIEHVATGARCRFWYGSADIQFPWLDDRALECTTRYDWVSATLALYSFEGPARPVEGVSPSYLGVGRTLPEIARALAQDRIQFSPGARLVSVSPVETLTTPKGRRVEYVSFAVEGPGGGPDGTEQRHSQFLRIAVVDDWLVVAAAFGAKKYQVQLNDYAQSNFTKVIASMEEGERLAFFRK
jgi:hypothetical protein